MGTNKEKLSIDECLVDIANRAMRDLLRFLIREAYESVSEPIERYSLKHQVRQDKECLASMCRDVEGEWVPWRHHQAAMVALHSAVSALREFHRAALDVRVSSSTEGFEEAINTAADLLRKARDAGLDGIANGKD